MIEKEKVMWYIDFEIGGSKQSWGRNEVKCQEEREAIYKVVIVQRMKRKEFV